MAAMPQRANSGSHAKNRRRDEVPRSRYTQNDFKTLLSKMLEASQGSLRPFVNSSRMFREFELGLYKVTARKMIAECVCNRERRSIWDSPGPEWR
jgi:hypothetical protein